MKYRMTRHADRRWTERFSDFDLRAELAEVIPFGDAEHGRKMLLSPCGAVFVVAGRYVITVLTEARVLDMLAKQVQGA